MSELDRLVQRRSQTGRTFFSLLQGAGLADQSLPISVRALGTLNNRRLLNFVNSDYLGLSRHPLVIRYACLGAANTGISTGMPRMLGQHQLSEALELALARCVRQEKAAIFSSTTHAALDLIPLLAGKRGVVFIDQWAYPISLEGAHAALRSGAKLAPFPHNDASALEQALRTHRDARDKVIICDGVYSTGGGKAALKEFSVLAEKYGAIIYLDDAHGFGILGEGPQNHAPYGFGGGGTPLFEGIPAGNLVYVASLSKALGVPLAFAAGPATFIEFVNRVSKSFTHSSQPALPLVAAAMGALQVNKAEGDRLRKKLAQRVKQFIRGFQQADILTVGNGYFPIQSLYFQSSKDAWQTGVKLRRHGIWPLLQVSPIDIPTGGALRFVISAKHGETEIERVHAAICSLTGRQTLEAGFQMAFMSRASIKPGI